MIAGRYRVGRTIGCGGMAEVYDGWDTHLDRPVAVKLLHPFLRSQPEMRERFRTEARAAASLSHPNIVCVHDSGDDAGTPYIVMERLPGTSVADEIRGGPLPEARVRGVLDDVLKALDTAHRAGVLHRDIKPGNILHASHGHGVKVADFGIAKALDAGKHTKTGDVLGTMAYLSPERLVGAPASIADDLYALGVVGYESLTGRPRFHRDHAGALAHAIMTEQPPPISVLRPDAEPGLLALIERATTPAAHARFSSATEMLAALHGRTVVQAPRPTKVFEVMPQAEPLSLAYVSPAPRRAGRRTKVLVGVGAAAAAAVTATIVVVASQSPVAPVAPAEPAAPATPVVPAPVATTSPTATTPPASVPAPGPGEVKKGNGNRGNGNGNGNGKKSPRDDD